MNNVEFDPTFDVAFAEADAEATINFLESIIEVQMYELGTLKLDIPLDSIVIY